MANPVALSVMRADVRSRADIETSEHVSDTDIDRWINNGIADVHKKLMKSDPDFFTVEVEITPTSASDYDLEDDFLSIRGVWYGAMTDPIETRSKIYRFHYQEMGIGPTPGGLCRTRYKVIGQSIRFVPVPQSNRTITVAYVPIPTLLEEDEDTWDSVLGLEEYPVEFACWKARVKAEEDFSGHIMALNEMKDAIGEIAGRRDVSGAPRIARVRQAQRRFQRRGVHF